MQLFTRNLSGPALSFATAIADGWTFRPNGNSWGSQEMLRENVVTNLNQLNYAGSHELSQAIISRLEKEYDLSLVRIRTDDQTGLPVFAASADFNEGGLNNVFHSSFAGIAALRCFVDGVLGSEIAVPDSLVEIFNMQDPTSWALSKGETATEKQLLDAVSKGLDANDGSLAELGGKLVQMEEALKLLADGSKKGWAVAKSLQTQVGILTRTLKNIAEFEYDMESSSVEEDAGIIGGFILAAKNGLLAIENHKEGSSPAVPDLPTPIVVVSVAGGMVQYAASNTPNLELIVHDEDALSVRGLSGEQRSEILDSIAPGCSQIRFEDSVDMFQANIDQRLIEEFSVEWNLVSDSWWYRHAGDVEIHVKADKDLGWAVSEERNGEPSKPVFCSRDFEMAKLEAERLFSSNEQKTAATFPLNLSAPSL